MMDGQSPVVYIGSENAPRRKAACRSAAAWSSEELILQGGPLRWVECQLTDYRRDDTLTQSRHF